MVLSRIEEPALATPVLSDAGNQGLRPDALKDDPRWQALQRVIVSQTFSKATRLVSFLNYICERTLLGRSDEISEQQLGIHVFGRAPDYNPAIDNIVRGTARQLRQRLAVYYQEEGMNDPLRIAVPRGAYIPVFEPAAAESVSEPQIQEAAEPPEIVQPGRTFSARWFVLGAAAIAFAACLLFWFSRPGPVERFWRLVFSPARKTLLVSGDSGFVMFQNLTGRTVHLPEYAAGNFRSNATSPNVDATMLDSLGGRRYTSFSDLKFAARLVQRPQVVPSRLEIRYARDLRVEDLKQANAVLVGAPQGNPWVEMFVNDLNFYISSNEAARTLTVVNRSPNKGEQPAYTYSHFDPIQRAYATIALIDNLDHSGKVLLVQGATVAGVDAGADFLFNDGLMKPLIEEWLNSGGPNGRFELLIETRGIAANGSTVKLIARHFGKP